MALLDASAIRPVSKDSIIESQPAFPSFSQSTNEVPDIVKRGYKGGSYHWSNWANITHAFPTFYHRPETVEDLSEILQYINTINQSDNQSKTVRIVGCGHSPNDMAVTNAHMIDMCRIARLIAVDRAAKQITIESGMQINELLEHCERNDLAFPSLGSIGDQTVGGILGSGTHGTGVNCGIIATCVTRLTLLKADGTIIECSKDVNSDLFSAALLNLGAIGVVTQITFQCVDAFDFVQHHTRCRFDELMQPEAFNKFLVRSEYPRIHWFPHVDQLIATNMHSIPARTQPRTQPSLIEQKLWMPLQYFIMHFIFPCMLFIAIYVKSFTPWINRIMCAYLHPHKSETVVTPSRDGFIFDCLFAQYVNEWVIPREHTIAAMNGLRSLIAEQGLTVDFPIEVRFIQRDDIMMSPANMSCEDLTYIGIISFRPFNQDNPQMRQYFASFAEMMYQLGGRPHWAKSFQLDRKQLSVMYGDNYHKFDAIRRECDPKGLFVNEYIKRLFEC